MLLIDAANIIGSRRTVGGGTNPSTARALVDRVRRATAAGVIASPVVVVLEGQAKRGVDEGFADGVEVVHAPGLGDDTLVERATECAQPVVLVSPIASSRNG